jgi:RNA-directed DNA polymerase
VTWKEYETGLENRLADPHSRVHRGAYRAQADGRQRPLGISALEDKIVQQAGVIILNETGTQPASSAGRAEYGPILHCKRVNSWMRSHAWTMKFVQHRVDAPRILRLIQKWLQAGVPEVEAWRKKVARGDVVNGGARPRT